MRGCSGTQRNGCSLVLWPHRRRGCSWLRSGGRFGRHHLSWRHKRNSGLRRRHTRIRLRYGLKVELGHWRINAGELRLDISNLCLLITQALAHAVEASAHLGDTSAELLVFLPMHLHVGMQTLDTRAKRPFCRGCRGCHRSAHHKQTEACDQVCYPTSARQYAHSRGGSGSEYAVESLSARACLGFSHLVHLPATG